MTEPESEEPVAGRRIQLRLTILTVAVCLISVGLAYALVTSNRMARWEYQVVAPNDFHLEQELNRLGSEGWEIAAARRATSGSGYAATAAYELILKRPQRTGSSRLSLGFGDGKEQAYIASMKDDLRNLITAQEAYFADQVTYAHSVSHLNYSVSAGNTVTIGAATGTGWNATASNSATTTTCGIYVGAVSAPIPDEPEGAPTCR